MLNIDSSVKHIALFPNVQYVLKERHYRIDQCYKMGTGTEHGLTAIHYTETYFAIHKGEHPQKIVIHVYLDINGHYLYSQVSPLTPLTAEQAELFKNREKTLKDNVNESKKLITALLNEKNARFMSAKTQADGSEASLSELSRSISTPNALKKYITTCTHFIQQVATANLYNDTPDSRGVYIATLIPKLRQRLELLQKLSIQSVVFTKNTKQCTDAEPDSAIVCMDDKPTNSIESLVKETIDNLSNYLKQIQENKITCPTRCMIKPNCGEIAKTYPLILEIKQYLLISMCLPSGISKNNMSQITSLCSTLNLGVVEYEKYCLHTLAMSARNGNYTIFQSLFRLLENDIKENFYEELINVLVMSKKEAMIQSIVKTCNFLHAHSVLYRETVLKISNEKKYTISIEVLKKINPEYALSTLYEDQESSLLFKAYIENHMEIFNMLLKHGANANTWGLRNSDGTWILFTLLQMIATYRTTDYLSYIGLLLQHDANPNIRYHKNYLSDLTLSKLKTKVENKKEFSRPNNSNRVKIKTEIMHSFVRKRTVDDTFGAILDPLHIMGKLNYSEGVRLLLPYSNVDTLAVFIARTIFKDLFIIKMKTHKTSLYPWIKVHNSEEKKIMFPSNTKPQSHPFIEYLIYPATPLNDQKKPLIQENALYIYVAYALLGKKLNCTVLHNKDFDDIYTVLLNTGIESKLQNKAGEAYIRFLACEFLITMRISLLKTLQEQYLLLQKHISIITPLFIEVCTQAFESVSNDTIKILKEFIHIWEIRRKAFNRMKVSMMNNEIAAVAQSALIDYGISEIPLSWAKDFPELFELATIKDTKQLRDEIDSDTDEIKENEERTSSLQTELKLPIYADTYFCESLFMRPIFPLDYRWLKACFNDANNMRYWGSGTCIKGSVLKDQFIRHAARNLHNACNSGWSIITHKGIAGCFWAWKNDSETEVEIAYVLSAEFSGRGLAINAGKLVLQYQCAYPNFIGKIIATVHPNNQASQCVLEKLGLKKDPERQNVPKFGSVRNYYALEVEAPKNLILYSFNKKKSSIDEKQEPSIRKMDSIVM